MLGIREPEIYGSQTYRELLSYIERVSAEQMIYSEVCQSNHEGIIVDMIQHARGKFDGIIINPAAYTHTSVAILDALKAASLPTVEVHLTEPKTREPFRGISYAGMACQARFAGMGFEGYARAIEWLKNNMNTKCANK